MGDLGNKILGGLVLALIVVVGGRTISAAVFKPDELDKQAYMVEGLNSGGGSVEAKAAAPLTAEQFAALVEKSSPEDGAKVFKKCSACHSADAGGANKVGPALHGVFGRKVGSASGFAYSAAVSGHGGNWDVDSLNKWLADPKAYIAGNKMAFAGVKKDEDRAALIAYLKSLK